MDIYELDLKETLTALSKHALSNRLIKMNTKNYGFCFQMHCWFQAILETSFVGDDCHDWSYKTL